MIGRIAAGFLLLLCGGCEGAAPAPAQPRPTLYLLTGLPIAFGEGFTLGAAKSPVMAGLERQWNVRLVDGPENLNPRGLLLAAQPRALTPERLVALDAWVRGGGRLLLLADPRLTWPSELPLGDRQRPPYSFADTGLLAHWGLRSEAPAPGATAAVSFEVGGQPVSSDSPGLLTNDGKSCTVAKDSRSAICGLGKGRALVVADADFLRLPEGVAAVNHALLTLNR